ncbi:MAG: alpha/beta hydrolase, partial [Pirellulales bacterium]|nr:alpha/beta hydrolase [Pirellulales bacterium]
MLFTLLLVAAARGADAAEVAIQPDVVYGHKDGLAMTFDVYRPDESNGGTILFMVSGGWFSSWRPPEQMLPMFAPFTDEGFTVIAVRHGSSPRYGISEAVGDVRRAVRYVRYHAADLKVDPERLGALGMSAGGHLSLMLATTADEGDAAADDPVLKASDRVKAVCAWVAPTDLRPVAWSDPNHEKQYENFPGLDITQAVAAEMSPLLAVSADDSPALLIAGDQDTLVPIWHSEKILTAFESVGVPTGLVTIEGAGHGFAGDDMARAVSETV